MKRCFASVTLGLALAAMTGCGRNPETTPPPADSTTAASPANATTTTAAAKPSHTTYSLAWGTQNAPASVAPGAAFTVQVSAKNTGDWTWNHPAAANPSKPDGSYAVRLVYNWVSPDGKPLPGSNTRGELTAPVKPGEDGKFAMNVQAPKSAGSYQLQFDLVEELVAFFSAKGNEKLTVPVTVQ